MGAVSSWCEEFAQWTPSQNELTVERSVAKRNEQLLKKVKPQEVTSLAQTPRSNDGHLETDCKNNFSDLRNTGEGHPKYESL